LDHPAIRQHLDMQIDYTNRFYNWNKIGYAWAKFLEGAINARRK
jgi:hypothetical protein